jgi:hypothetical protein
MSTEKFRAVTAEGTHPLWRVEEFGRVDLGSISHAPLVGWFRTGEE